MSISGSDNTFRISAKQFRISQRIFAIVACFAMIMTAFFTMAASANDGTIIVTSQDEYAPGETVLIKGMGFVQFVPVVLTISHPDFEFDWVDTVVPDWKGEFAYDKYVAEPVVDGDTPVTVTAYQDELHQATTQFWDPDFYIQGWTLEPFPRWKGQMSSGEIRGFFEGDSIPMKAVVDYAPGTYNISIGVDFILEKTYSGYRIFGIDYLTQYWIDPETDPNGGAPFNTYSNSSTPFRIDAGTGTIISQERVSNILESNRIVQVWNITLRIDASDSSPAIIRFGAHLALTNESGHYYGASYYAGSSLHVRLVSGTANRDVPIAANKGAILTPPEMHLNKTGDKKIVIEGEIITFTLRFNNTGQAEATCVALDDWMPEIIDFIPGSAVFWTSETPTPMPVPFIIDDHHLIWNTIGTVRGTGDDDKYPPLEYWVRFQARINTSDEGCYTNVARLTYGDGHGGYYPPLWANYTFCIQGQPDIKIEKTGPLFAHVGDTITYVYNVTNTGYVDLKNVDIIDNITGTIAANQDLLRGESKIYSKTYTISAMDHDHLFNKVTVTGEDDYGRIVSDNDTWELDILHPMINVTKSADKNCGEIGEEIWYTIVVSNPSLDTDLFNVTVTDTLFGIIWVGNLPSLSSHTIIKNLTIGPLHLDPLENVVTATGEDRIHKWVSDEAKWTVDILHPQIEVTKTADKSCAEIGELVTYEVNVSNPSDDTSMYVWVNDSMFTTPIWNGWLAPGDWKVITYSRTILKEDEDPLENVVTVDAVDYQGHLVKDSASFTVDIYHPMIDIKKGADKSCAEIGEIVTYWFNVSNPSWDTPMEAWANDTVLGPLWHGFLAPNSYYNFSAEYVITETDPDPLINVVTVEAYDPQGHKRTASDCWEINIYHPAILVTKESNVRCVGLGDTILYWINVTNPSPDTAMYVWVNDSMLGGTIFQGWIAQGTTKYLSKTYVVKEGDPDPIVNIVKVDAYDPQGHDEYAEASCTIDFVHPAIVVTKVADKECAAVGELVTYTITVTNPQTADVWLNGTVEDKKIGFSVSFSDLKPGETLSWAVSYPMPDEDPFVNTVWANATDHQGHRVSASASWSIDVVHPAVEIEITSDKKCAAVDEIVTYWFIVTNPATADVWLNGSFTVEPIGWSQAFNNLKPGDSLSWYGTYPMPANIDVFTIWANVTAYDHQMHEVTGKAVYTVDVVHPDVEITKEANKKCAAVGEDVIYWINVTNPSTADVWLNGTVEDQVVSFFDVFYNLKPGETKSWEITIALPEYLDELEIDPFINTATVVAYDHQQHKVVASASWSVDVVHPEIMVTKKADKECAAVGELVTYTITVTNPQTADVWLNGTVEDKKIGFSVSFSDLKPGETLSWAVSYPMPDEDPFVNIVYVNASDHQGHALNVTASWAVDVVHPAITIEKISDVLCAGVGDTVIYTIVVSVPQDADVTMTGTVWDDLIGFSDTFILAPGQSKTWTLRYIVQADDPDPIVNQANVSAVDHQGHLVEANDTQTIDFVHPAVSITKASDKSCAAVGELVTYWLNVTNPSTADVWLNGTVEDQVVGFFDVFYNLKPGETKSWELTYPMPSGVDVFINTAIVCAYDHQEHKVMARASAAVDVVHPEVVVTKTADKSCAAAGEFVTYTITVTNPQTADVWLNGTVVDALIGFIVSFTDLVPGASISWTVTYAMPDVDPFVNTVTVIAYDHQMHEVSDTDSWAVDVVHPDVTVTMTADKSCAAVGEDVTYTITVTNPETADVWLNGSLLVEPMGWIALFFDLAPGKSESWTGTYATPDQDPFIAYVNVTAYDHQAHMVTANATWTVDVVHPAITVTKQANLVCAIVGEEVTYYINVTNPASADVWLNGTVADYALQWAMMFYNLKPGETRSWVVRHIITENDGDPFVNEVLAWGYDHQGHYVEASDSWEVNVMHPMLTLTKTADKSCAAVGEEIHYVITIYNPSTDTILNMTIEDLVAGVQQNWTLYPQVQLTIRTSILAPDVDPLINIVYVNASDHQGHALNLTASWLVDIVHPDMIVSKVADKSCAAVGEDVTYTITVTNPETADVWLNGTVEDLEIGLREKFSNLMPGQSVSWQLTVAMPDIDPFVNIVYVNATDHQNHPLSMTASWVIDVVHPAIMVEKTADKSCAEVGEMVNYTVKVWVPESADVWMNGTVYDKLDNYAQFVLGTFENLKPGDMMYFNFSYVIQANDPDPLSNSVLVIATDHQEHEKRWSSVWWIDVVHPAIQITKTPNKACAHVGETIIYTINVGVPSWADVWMNGTVTDSMLGLIGSFTNLKPGEWKTWAVTYVVPPAVDPVVNTATVVAYDHQMHERNATAECKVDILHPEIVVTKEGPIYADVGDIILYYVNVTNNATDTTLYNITVIDDVVGFIVLIPVLLPGETSYLTYTWTMPPGVPKLDNTVTASGEDKQHVWVSDSDSWTVITYGRVSGYKFGDVNLNKVFDPEEIGLQNWLIVLNGTLDEGGYDNRTRLTDSNGYYEFTKLKPGFYMLREVLLTGWMNVTVSSYSFTIIGGEQLTGENGLDFGNVPLGRISGYKWCDEDLDGVFDPSEKPIANWTVHLDMELPSGGLLPMIALTDSNGYYEFANLTPAVYYLYEIIDPNVWFCTAAPPFKLDLSALEQFNLTDMNFGNVKYGKISGFKFLDLNFNGYKDGDESGLANWTITLVGTLNNGAPYGPVSTLTDLNGYYEFALLLPGVYTLSEILKPGWKNTTPHTIPNIIITCGYHYSCGKFGNIPLGSICGWKFIDWNMNQGKDGNEPGIQGWNITIWGWLSDGYIPYNPEGATPFGPITIKTSENGSWCFNDLLPGVYFVREENRTGWYHTTTYMIRFTILPGTHVKDVKFGNVPYVCIYGWKFEDIDADGVWDDNEPGLANWTIILEGVRADGKSVRIVMITDENGYYVTCFNVLPGVYLLYEEVKEGWIPTIPAQYEIVIPYAGCPQIPFYLSYNFANFKLGKICGWKYEDMDGDGILDPEDTPIANWTIELYNSSGVKVTSTVTNESGGYCFANLTKDTYTVKEVMKPNWVATSPTQYTVDVFSGTEECLPPFLNYEKICIFGHKFEDLNSNGIWDAGEPYINDWKIYLYNGFPSPLITYTAENGSFGFCGLEPGDYTIIEEIPNGWVYTTPYGYKVTVKSGDVVWLSPFGNFHCVDIVMFKFEDVDSDGFYDEGYDRPIEGWNMTIYKPSEEFVVVKTNESGIATLTACEAGWYLIVEEERAGWCHTTWWNAWRVYVTSGHVEYFENETLPYDVTPSMAWFPNFRCVNITVFKYEDVDSDRRYDPEIDHPLLGWNISLYDTSHGIWYNGTTGEDGLVSFTLCKAGYYLLTEELKDGWCQLVPLEGFYYLWVESGLVIDLESQMPKYYYEFANFECVKITIFKYWDKCSNGWYDPGEPIFDEPLSGWKFWLIDEDGYWYYLGETNESGLLEFKICKAGNYTVVEEDREGWSHIKPASGRIDISVVSGDTYTLWFGNYKHVKIPIFKYEDVDSDGVYDEGYDNPIEGWNFTMHRIGDPPSVYYYGSTDENGMLIFIVNRSGTYIIDEEERAGWTHIEPASGIRSISVTSNMTVPVQEFGNFKDVTIEIFKFEDVDSDGVYDENYDRPIEGWNMTIFGPGLPNGQANIVIQTNSTGIASVTVNRSGWYYIYEEMRSGWCNTTWWTAWTVCVTSGHVEYGWENAIDPETGELYNPDIHIAWFANFRCVDIVMFKFEDVDSDGFYDEGYDRPIEGWNMTIYKPGGEIVVVSTNESGIATLTVCRAGWYLIVEEERAGWCHTTWWNAWRVYVTSGHVEYFENETLPYDVTPSMAWFPNFECVTIDVFKYNDVNSNGQYDEGIDMPIESWGFDLYDSLGTWITANWTDATGHATFTVCNAGTWTVIERSYDGWTHINPADGELSVSIVSGDEPETLMFGNFLNVCIPVLKYNDKNSNGIFDEGDVPIEGWNFTISGPGVMNPTATTNVNGIAWFCVNRSGTYTITEENRVGWTHIIPADGVLTVTVQSGDIFIWPFIPMFGNFHDVHILVFKFDDVYADGQYSPIEGDSPISGWNITLWVWDPILMTYLYVETKATNATGYAEFVVNRSGWYLIEEEERDGWWWVSPRWGYYEVYVVSCMPTIYREFANFKMGKIFGYKWEDINGNGLWDPNEPALKGWKVEIQLWVGPSYLEGETTTDENGYYEFLGLWPAVYKVWEESRSGWTNTTPSVRFVSIWGHYEVNVSFGNFKLGCIEGYKYEDVNGNGKYDAGDRPIQGWNITLAITTGIVYDDEGHPMSAIMIIGWTLTDFNGYYRFCGLGPGIYIVYEQDMNGWIHMNASSEEVVMTSNATIRIHDFMNFKLGKICGSKFNDLNSNGIWDDGESYINGWPIYLYNSFPGYRTTWTAKNGSFCFNNLGPGTYTVIENLSYGWTNTNPYGYIMTIKSGDVVWLPPFGNFKNVSIPIFKFEDVNGNGVFDNGDRPLSGWKMTLTGPCFPIPLEVYTNATGWAIVWVTAAGTYTVTEDLEPGWKNTTPSSLSISVISGDVIAPLKFGNMMPGKISGFKVWDKTMNSTWDPKDVPLEGWIIWINGTTNTGIPVHITRITDDTGYYEVLDLWPGTYTVTEQKLTGWKPMTPSSVSVSVVSMTDSNVTFLNTLLGRIQGQKFYDKNVNGIMDGEDYGLPNWWIKLEGYTQTGEYVEIWKKTNATGWFVFDEVRPGDYNLTESLKTGWTNTTELPIPINVGDMTEYFNITINIGNVKYGRVYGYKFLDTYSDVPPFYPNGKWDSDETALGNWEITLQGWTYTGVYVSRVAYTNNTGKVGYYEFDKLLPGEYWVNETTMAGMYATTPKRVLVEIYANEWGPIEHNVTFGNMIPSKDPEWPFTLQEGWNLWSCPLIVKDLTAKTLLETIGPKGVVVTRLNRTSGLYESYVAGIDKNNFPIVLGEGYYIWVSDFVSFTLVGELTANNDSQLKAGWNIIGSSTPKAMMASEVLNLVSGGNALVITYLDAETGKYYSYVKGFAKNDFVVTPGRAYFIWVDVPCTISFPMT